MNIAASQTAAFSFRVFDALDSMIDNGSLAKSEIRWSSTEPSIATVDSLGIVSASTLGRTGIVLDVDGKADTAIVTVVPVPVATVVLNVPSQIGLSAGLSYTISAIARDASGSELSGRAFMWSSSDANVASVSPNGVVTGVNPGSARVVATSEGQSAEVGVIVSPSAVATVSVALPAATLDTGRISQAIAVARDASGSLLTGRSVVWSTDNSAAATVSSLGAVRGVAVGAATITARVDGVAGSAKINVGVSAGATTPAPIATITVAVTPSALTVAQTAQAVATARDSGGNPLTGRSIVWTSSNPSIASVSASGVVTAISNGSAAITALGEGKSGSAPVNVAVSAPSSPVTGVLVSHDFEDGTLGPYWNPWGTGIDVIDDPTGAGHGKVARMHYAAASEDANKALGPKTGFGVGLGDSVWFRGDFYLPAEVNDQPVVSMRKLNYWGSLNDGYHFREQFSMVLTLQGSQLEVTNTAVGPSNLPSDYTYTPTFITKGQWHRLEIQLKVNSSFAAQDGVLRIWIDGAIVYDRSNERWTDPLWTDDPSTYKWEAWGIGYQMQSQTPYDEYRYWDNMTFSKTRVLP